MAVRARWALRWAALCLGLGLTQASNECTVFQQQVDGVTITCSGHGTCTSQTKRCHCEDTFGSDADLAKKLMPPLPKPDCSEKVCPLGKSWADVPTSATTAHAEVECSDRGSCDRIVGACICLRGYEGSACQLRSCRMDSTDPESPECSGHGQCLTLSELATKAEAQPINIVTSYGGSPTTTTWDEDMITSCLCDSSWTVGLASGETQLPEFFGPYCERRRCPSGDDPMTTADETDCAGVVQDPITGATTADVTNGGATGNLCHVDCSNRGICNHETGVCTCFRGYAGEACENQDVLST